MSTLTTVTGADGVRLAVEHLREGAHPVVFVHGSFGGLRSWNPVVAHLPEEFAAWTYARRGYPPSGPSAADHTFAADVADLAAVVTQVGAPPHVVAGSHGATVALRAALAEVPVRSLVVLEPPLYSAGPALAGTLDGVRAARAAGDDAAVAGFLRNH